MYGDSSGVTNVNDLTDLVTQFYTNRTLGLCPPTHR